MRVRFGIVNLPPRLKRGMLVELGPGEINKILDWTGMETHAAPQVSPDQAAAKFARGKLTTPHHAAKSAKPRSYDKQNDRTGGTQHKSKPVNSPAPRGKTGSSRRIKPGKI
jgi:23S rRNA pseudouridine2605 synthase